MHPLFDKLIDSRAIDQHGKRAAGNVAVLIVIKQLSVIMQRAQMCMIYRHPLAQLLLTGCNGVRKYKHTLFHVPSKDISIDGLVEALIIELIDMDEVLAEASNMHPRISLNYVR